jgi:glycosyltransferase involved in cell wall biosynthesis
VSTIDITATLAIQQDEAYMERATALLEGADAVMLEHPYLLPVVESIRPGIPVILDAQNVEIDLKRAMYRSSAAADALLEAVGDVERRAIARADLVVACTTEDSAILQQMTPTMAAFVVVPNGTDVESYEFITGPARLQRRDQYLESARDALGLTADHIVVFVGSAHRPNAEAGELLLRIAADMPDALFVLVGAHTEMVSRWRVPSNVVLRGIVSRSELTALLTSCDVAVNPMLSGSGSNIKLLDYFASGAPTVSTLVGARGFGVEAGRHALVVDVEQLVPAIRSVLDDPAAGTDMVLAARSLAEDHTWPAIGLQFKQHVDRLLGASPHHVPREAAARSDVALRR